MEKGNSIKRATSAEAQEEGKRKIKAFRSEIYDLLDKGNKKVFTNHGENGSQNKLTEGKDNGRSENR
ncbi:hypothetical protein [Catonella massiliensis]|uniref:Uncharacterized protein n=1 Tax=Catonella massiliensis TaxID=2799636 RepID=A0ABS1J0W6_9FIRM|nr:hypothetical protein [Catonella massiliensis]MBK5897791.1 hypothetical protein [Catonella massiliensis]